MHYKSCLIFKTTIKLSLKVADSQFYRIVRNNVKGDCLKTACSTFPLPTDGVAMQPTIPIVDEFRCQKAYLQLEPQGHESA